MQKIVRERDAARKTERGVLARTFGLPAVGGMLACGIPSCEALGEGYSVEFCRN